jgi:hypothetical protein
MAPLLIACYRVFFACATVIISDPLELPFPLSLDFTQFSIRWTEPEFLEDPVGTAKKMIASADVKRLQEQLLVVRRHLMYRSPHSRVATWMLKEANTKCGKAEQNSSSEPPLTR